MLLSEAPWHVAGRIGYISQRWDTFQFPWEFQTVQECTVGYKPGNFWRHQCCGEKPTQVNPVAMLCQPHTDQDFDTNILSRFRNSAHGEICRTNRIIQHIGYRHYCLRKSTTVKTSRSKEERNAGACTPPHQVQGDCERRVCPGNGGDVIACSPPHPQTGDRGAGRRLGEG